MKGIWALSGNEPLPAPAAPLSYPTAQPLRTLATVQITQQTTVMFPNKIARAKRISTKRGLTIEKPKWAKVKKRWWKQLNLKKKKNSC